MPPGTLRVLPDVLEAQSARLKRLRVDEFQAVLADLRTLSKQLDGAWSGEARAAFGDSFSGWLSRAASRGHDLERIAAFLSVTAADYRALEADLVGAASDVPDRPHQNDATRAHPSAVGGAGFGTGGGIHAGAGGTFSPIALTGNPLEDLWNWLMNLFGVAPQQQPPPTPTATTPTIVGVTPQPMPLPYPWDSTSSDGTSPVVCVADLSTTPANLQPYLINAACTNLIGQLEPDQAALLIQEVNSGQTILTPTWINGFWVLQATNTLTRETNILATAQDEDMPPATVGGSGAGSGGTGATADEAKRAATEKYVTPSGALRNIESATLDERRFVSYSLDPNNPQNDNKAVGFALLGYDVNTEAGRKASAADLIRQTDPQLAQAQAAYSKTTAYGASFELRTSVTGPNGTSGSLVTVWQYDVNGIGPRLISNWVEVHK